MTAVFTVREVAAMLRVTRRTVRKAILAGHLKAVRVGQGQGRWRILESSLKDYLELRRD